VTQHNFFGLFVFGEELGHKPLQTACRTFASRAMRPRPLRRPLPLRPARSPGCRRSSESSQKCSPISLF
jgi:hypothetical protein